MKQKLIVAVVLLAAVAAIFFIARPAEAPVDEPETGSREGGAGHADGLGGTSGRSDTPQGVTRDGGTAEESPQEAVALARFTRDTRITGLNGGPVSLTHLALRTALAAHEPRFHVCMTEHGGADAFRAATQAQRAAQAADGGVRPPRTERPTQLMPDPRTGEMVPMQRVGRYASFDVRPDGTVDPASISMDPPVPEPFAQCFTEHVAALRINGAGAGAHVEMPLAGPRQRILPHAAGDAGVAPAL